MPQTRNKLVEKLCRKKIQIGRVSLIFGAWRATVLQTQVGQEERMSSSSLDLHGIFTAIVTPFSKDGSAVDKASLSSLVDFQVASRVQGLVACGSTGEATTLSDAEYVDVVKFVRAETKGKVPCVAGISVSATSRAVEMARIIEELGCDGILVATPPYNKPSQAGIIAHFKALRAATSLPLIAYNIPGRSGVSVSSATLGVLSQEGVICGVKESSGSVDTIAETVLSVQPDCQVVAGEDSLLLATLAYGGVGAICASANVMPTEFVSLCESFAAGNIAAARQLQLDMLPRIRSLFCESNPVPAKAVLALKGIIKNPTVRLPLTELSPANLERVRGDFSL